MNARFRLLGLLLSVALASVAAVSLADKPAPPKDPETVRDVFLLLDQRPLHLRLHITIRGKSPAAVRREYLERLFKSLDADNDSKLTRAEFERSPLNTSRRGSKSRPLSAKEAAETVPASRLTADLERVAGETLAFRQNNTARTIDDRVFASLNENNDGVLTDEEIARATDLLLTRDQDDDDCITLDEFTPPEMTTPALVPGTAPERPLAAVSSMLIDGTSLLFGPRLVRRYDRNRDGKLSLAESSLSPEVFRALDADKDGKLSAEELKALHKQTPEVEASFDLEPPAGSKEAQVKALAGPTTKAGRPDFAMFGFGDTQLALALRTFDPVAAALNDAREQFNRLDVDMNGYLDRDEVKAFTRFQRGLFETIDTNGDDKIFWPEMETYARSRAEAAATRCDIVLHDLGHGYFESLDLNHDGRVGLRELRVAGDTLRRLRKPGQALLRPNDPAKRLHLEVVRASFQLFGTGPTGESTVPQIIAQPRTAVGPLWFQRMDRNQDGDLTWKEFLGPRHVFEELDADHDGLIDPKEASK